MNNWEDISALADDQLEATTAADMRKAMEANPALKSQYEAILSLKRSLRNDLPDHDSPETLSLCLDRIREVDRVGRTENVVHKFRYAIVSGLAALIVGAAVFNQVNDGGTMDRNAIARSLTANLAGGSQAIQGDSQASAWLRNQLGKRSHRQPPPRSRPRRPVGRQRTLCRPLSAYRWRRGLHVFDHTRHRGLRG